MAFRFECNLEGYEYRGMRTGVGGNGRQWMSLVLESPDDASQIDVSVPTDLQDDIYSANLHKGDFLSLRVLAVSSERYSYIRLVQKPVVYDANGEVI